MVGLTAVLIWGMNKTKGKKGENAFLLEGSWRENKIAIYSRYEWVKKSSEELDLDETVYGQNTLFSVNIITAGLNYDLLQLGKASIAAGGQYTFYGAATKLNSLYGKYPMAFEIYLRIYPQLMKM